MDKKTEGVCPNRNKTTIELLFESDELSFSSSNAKSLQTQLNELVKKYGPKATAILLSLTEYDEDDEESPCDEEEE
ncbi:hypothetical protein COLO4_30708 [Corchorus olitorius]|uniref:Uncharacterized protein n=1 Tax=Corchorus olitorius TaxID=93759 RepID=A0A1R3H752_9ROSI|nr:hypothetical protein COLO4_30708 [Corchorus olitorius]